MKNINPVNMMFGGSDQQKDPEKMSAAEKKMKMLDGYQAIWYKTRRSGWYYFIKCMSIFVSIAFAGITLSFKRTTQVFMIQELNANTSLAKD